MKRYFAGVNKLAKGIAKASGAGDLVEYAGAKLAKTVAPKARKQYIKSNVTGGQALKSAGKTAATIATLAAGGALGSAARAAKAAKVARAAKAVKVAKPAKKVAVVAKKAKKVAPKGLKIKKWTDTKKGVTQGPRAKDVRRKQNIQDRYDLGKRRKR